MKGILAIAVVILIASTARAEILTCTSTIDVKNSKNILYKNENIHGGRGRTFLDQNKQLRRARTLKIAGMNGTVFSCFGLFKCDKPYGCRYYQAMCKDTLSNKKFIQRATDLGGSYVLVSNGKGKCFKVLASAKRYGSVRK